MLGWQLDDGSSLWEVGDLGLEAIGQGVLGREEPAEGLWISLWTTDPVSSARTE